MNTYVLGAYTHPPALRIGDKRLEELVFDTARAALGDAHVEHKEIDHVTIAACDELDGRSISSMLLAAPAGAYLRDEIKCTDSGLTGLCLAAMRIESGLFDVGLVVSWSKTSIAPFEDVMRMRGDPFFTRPIGLNATISDGLFAAALSSRFGMTEADAVQCAADAYVRALANPRGMRHPVPTRREIASSPMLAVPLREGHRATMTDGAAALVIASERYVSRRCAQPLARITGFGWRNERYQLGAERLAGLEGLRASMDSALATAGLTSIEDLDLFELDNQTAFHELAIRSTILDGARDVAVSPSGGAFAQNPYFCMGLVNAAEVVMQLSQRAGPVQVPNARLGAAHGSHGFAQQGNVVVIMEAA